jgi:hypothetical protein
VSGAVVTRTTGLTRLERLTAPLRIRYLRWQLKDNDDHARQLERALRQHRYKSQALQAELMVWERT